MNLSLVTVKILLCAFLIGWSGLYSQSLNDHDSVSVYVVSHGWHTGIILPTSALPDSFFTQLEEYSSSNYLEFGWGDLAFYQNPDPGYWITVKAAVWPTKSALHVVHIATTAEQYFPYSDLIKITVSRDDFQAIAGFIQNAFALNDSERVIGLQKGIYGRSSFYLGREKYFFPRTCNVWTAQALKAGGLPLAPFAYQRAQPLLRSLAEYGEIIRLDDQSPEN